MQLVSSTPKQNVNRKTPNRRVKLGVVDQVRLACARKSRVGTIVGALLGGLVPFATFMIAHQELDLASPWTDPLALLVLGGLLYSATTVYQWGKLALTSRVKAFGFVVLVEGVMVCSSQQWLAVTALVYLILINAIATGVTLTQGARSD